MTFPDRNVKVYIQTNKRSFVEMNAVDFAKTLSQIEKRIDLFSIDSTFKSVNRSKIIVI